MAPPASWGLFIDEVRRYLTTRLGVADDSALDTVLEVQLAHLPAPTATFPPTLHLAHDYVAWHDACSRLARTGTATTGSTSCPVCARTRPAELKIRDPNDICSTDVGKPMGVLAFALRAGTSTLRPRARGSAPPLPPPDSG